MVHLFLERFSFSVHMFACDDESLNLLNLLVHNHNNITRLTTRRREEGDIPGF